MARAANAIWSSSSAPWNALSSSPKLTANQSRYGIGSFETFAFAFESSFFCRVASRPLALSPEMRCDSEPTLRTCLKLPPLPGRKIAGVALVPSGLGLPSRPTSRRASPEETRLIPSRYRNRAYPRSFASVEGSGTGRYPGRMYVISHSFAPPNEGDKMCAHNAASAASASAAAASARRRDADIAPRAETCARWAEEAVRDRVGPPVLEKQQKNAFGFVSR